LFYLLGSYRIRRDSRRWHFALLIAAILEIGVLVSWFVCLRINTLDVARSIVISLLFAGLIAFSQVLLIRSLRDSLVEIPRRSGKL
jgi:hypothetical protein